MTIKALKGFKDILPEEVYLWQQIEESARNIFHRFGFTEIKIPVLEKTELFARSIGEATDIVEKEMYSFTDKNGESVTMRPEGTAPVIRAFIEHGMHVGPPVQRLYTIGPMFRHERPQKGRLRQFQQLSVEVLGTSHPRVDAEVIAMAWLLLAELGLAVSLELNSLGCPACRPDFKQALLSFLNDAVGDLCPDCERRRQTNPLRVLDCKSSSCREQYKRAPSVIDYLCPACEQHFSAVKSGLGQLGIPYVINKFMVRGLDYYNRTTFELVTGELGAQSAVGAGGRYDGLVAQLGGPDTPGIGFAMGVERLVLLLSRQSAGREAPGLDLYIAVLGEVALDRGFRLTHGLRRGGARVLMDHEGRSLKSQMKLADRLRARFTLMMGDDELARQEAVLKDMRTGEQEIVPLPGEDPEGWFEIILGKIR